MPADEQKPVKLDKASQAPKAEEIDPLTAEDEQILDAIWANIMLKRGPKAPSTLADLNEADTE